MPDEPRHTVSEDPLSPSEREEHELDLIAFCDRALALLGDISGLDVLYAGGAVPLWLEGLAERVGPDGSLTALESDVEKAGESRVWLSRAGLPCPARVVTGDVFSPPFGPESFDLVYSAGLLHELDVSERPARGAISALAATLRPGGRLVTDDFVDSVPAVQLEEEALEADLRRELSGAEPYGIGPPERLAALHEEALESVQRRVLPPFEIRHLDRVFLAGDEPEGLSGLSGLPGDTGRSLRDRWGALRERVIREGYTRPATLYVEGRKRG